MNLFTKQKQTHRLREQLWLPGGKPGEGQIGSLGLTCTPTIFKIDNQQGPTVQHRELCSIFCNNLNRKRIQKRTDTCIRITESLCCTPETNTTVLINYVPI